MEKHVSVVAALQIGLSIFGIIVGIIILVVLNTVGSFVNEREASLVLHLIGTILAVIFFLMSAPGIIAGIGLLRHKEWARILALILSALSVLNFPLVLPLACILSGFWYRMRWWHFLKREKTGLKTDLSGKSGGRTGRGMKYPCNIMHQP